MTGRMGTMRVHGLVPLWDAVRPVSPIGLDVANLLLEPTTSPVPGGLPTHDSRM